MKHVIRIAAVTALSVSLSATVLGGASIAGDEKGGAVDNGTRFFCQPTCHHAPEVYSGLAETDAADMLRDFFRARR